MTNSLTSNPESLVLGDGSDRSEKDDVTEASSILVTLDPKTIGRALVQSGGQTTDFDDAMNVLNGDPLGRGPAGTRRAEEFLSDIDDRTVIS